MAYAIKKGSDYFKAVTYTGNGTAVASGGNSITSLEFQPDLVWIKDRTSPYHHNISDVIRGASTRVYSSQTNAEDTNTESVNSFDSNGFTVGNNVGVNTSSNAYVAWNWKANGSGSSNSDGTITSQVSANPTSGFSVVTFTSPSSGAYSVGHGLGTTPSMVITKRRDSTSNWWTWHTGLGDNTTDYLKLNTNEAEASLSGMWGTVGRDADVIGYTAGTSTSGGSAQVAYCWAEVPGYSKFGTYTGNSNADGPFVYTGFKPQFFMMKPINTANSWIFLDTARDGKSNTIDLRLLPNSTSIEYDSPSGYVDFLSNGFKLRYSGAYNNSSYNYIYMAFAECPFKYANAL